MVQWTYTPSRSPPAKVQRRVVQWRKACHAEVAPDRPVVTFTFDDFPKSALNGADIVERYGGRAGFYACTSFVGQRSPVMGEMFDGATLAELRARGHEIGAHTHSHLDCARAGLAKVERDIGENLVALSEIGHHETVSSFAFPYGETSYSAKRWVGDVFATGRGILPGVNVGDCDRSQLRAVELGASAMHRRRALAALKTAIDAKGWLFFFTHDVSRTPTDYGVPADLLEELALRAVEAGAVLATPTFGAVLSGVID
ncbi:MAG: polysaccharide deacetylase family protein [Hyphomonadaceae bacterium]|nr:polysaccharide deacetylase family protein [Hyphomonadaceae bacterium]